MNKTRSLSNGDDSNYISSLHEKRFIFFLGLALFRYFGGKLRESPIRIVLVHHDCKRRFFDLSDKNVEAMLITII